MSRSGPPRRNAPRRPPPIATDHVVVVVVHVPDERRSLLHPSSCNASSLPDAIGLVLRLIAEFTARLVPTSLIPHPSVRPRAPHTCPPALSLPPEAFKKVKDPYQMSLVQIQHVAPAPEDPPTQPALSRSAAAPSHINLIAPQALCAFASSPHPSPSLCDNPFDSPPSSPPLPFYTAPSTPVASPQQEDPPSDAPLASIQQIAASASPPSPPPVHPRLPPSQPSCGIETIPPVDAFIASDLALDFTLDDEGLSTLEKIYLFSRSRSAHHRVFISHALPSFLASVTPLEAAEYVLPLLPSLAMDEDETVKEALASELVEILWWFLTHCLLVDESPDSATMLVSRQRDGDDMTLISVQAFTPILGTLLLSPNGMVSGPARCAVVDLLSRIRQADDAEECELTNAQPSNSNRGFFGRVQRQMFEEELINQLVIGIGRLDASVEDEDATEVWYDATARTPAGELPEGRRCTSSFLAGDQASVNPYFPHPGSHESPISSPIPTTVRSPLTPPPSVPSFQLTPEPSLGDASSVVSIAFRSEAACMGILPTAELHADFEPYLLDGIPHAEHRPVRQQGGETDEDLDPGEQAAVGRLSSMSLIAAVAAGGSLRLDAQRAFVREVERAGKDPVHWVRREASFALGALAKVIPEELVVSALLPLFETLRRDTIWHVRHSSLFALPAVLSRLTPALRRSVALSTVVPLSRDESSAVRSGVLEALGEVLYSFHTDECGPPDELLSLFLGRQEDRPISRTVALGLPVSLPFVPKLDLFYDDPVRPLACAFNYPAVALTLGRARWGELRPLYLALSRSRSTKVRKTLAASLGELAKVIGPENSRCDLLDVWWDAMRCSDDGDIRLKAIEALPLFVSALGKGEARDTIFSGLVKIWEEGRLRNWRAREGIVKIIPGLAGAPDYPECVYRMLKWGLEDDFGAVREASISVVTRMWREDGPWRTVLDLLQHDILQLAYASSFRKRMTYVAYQQAVALSCRVDSYLADQSNWRALERLASDGIVGVRIGVARLAGCLLDKFARDSTHIPQPVVVLVDRLRMDCSAEVRSYVPSPMDHPTYSDHSGPFETFSRPPPMTLRSFATLAGRNSP